MVADTGLLLNDALDRGDVVVFEGGQATMLDVDHGTYPFVTSSSATAGGAATGAGVGPNRLDRIVGIVKAYTTRVGSGPFPTELFDEKGDWLRSRGFEFGTTTGRPRRVGWYDAPITRYATRINGITDLVLTKLDILTGLDEIPVCVAYDVDGARFDEVPVNQSDFHHARPILEYLPGWKEDISGARDFEDLPLAAQDYVLALEEMSGTRISVIGVGAVARRRDRPSRPRRLMAPSSVAEPVEAQEPRTATTEPADAVLLGGYTADGGSRPASGCCSPAPPTTPPPAGPSRSPATSRPPTRRRGSPLHPQLDVVYAALERGRRRAGVPPHRRGVVRAARARRSRRARPCAISRSRPTAARSSRAAGATAASCG